MVDKLRLGIDLDGCLVDFNKEFLRISRRLLGKPEKNFVVTDFHYHNCGWTKPEADRVISWMRHLNNFWRGLERLPNTGSLTKRHREFNIFYITARFSTDGLPTNFQSEDWIRDNFSIQDPFVIVSEKKGELAKELELDYFVDDRFENCTSVADAVPTCKVSLLNQTWNKGKNDSRITRVEDINSWLKTIAQAKS